MGLLGLLEAAMQCTREGQYHVNATRTEGRLQTEPALEVAGGP